MTLVPRPDGFYELPTVPGAPVVFVSPAGADVGDGLTPQTPLATLAAARKKLKPGQPGTILLQAGARFVDQQLWVDGGTSDGPHVIATYSIGVPAGRAVIDVSASAQAALQARGSCFVSDIEFVGSIGKSAVRPYGKFEAFFQNCKVTNAGLGWDLSEVTASLHRCVTLDCYDPKGDKSQGLYITKGALRLTECVFHRCGWSPLVTLTAYSVDKNHCVYVDEDCAATAIVDGCFFGEPCSHGLQMRTGGSCKRSVFWRCPIGGFAQGPTGVIEDSFFEQQDAYRLGQGSAPQGTAELRRGWGWDLEATWAEMNRCGFYRGGGDGPTARAVALAKVNPSRTPPRTAPGITVTSTRVAAWTGGVRKEAPDAEIVRADIEVDGSLPRWPLFTVDPYVAYFRSLDRGSDWGAMAAAARLGYSALEQVTAVGPLRARYDANAAAVKSAVEAMRP